MGAPAKATRLMVGLQYLKYTFNESDESVVGRWVENPYGQYFCGYTHLQHECPIHPTSMSRWRKRVGADRLIRDIRRKASHPDEALATLLARADRVRQQQPHDTHKLYSLHEPEVQCISKGKTHKRYESCPEPRRIGQKVAVARHQPRELDGGRPAAARQSLRRTYADRHLDRRAGRDRCGRDRCVRGQGLSRAWLYGGGERPSARTTKRRLTGGAEAPATT